MTLAAGDQRADGRAELPALIEHPDTGRVGPLRLRFRRPGVAADGFDHVIGAVLVASGPEAVRLRPGHLAQMVDELVLEAIAVGRRVGDRLTPLVAVWI